jgi:hypothetical protein
MKSLQNLIGKIPPILPYLIVFVFSLYQPNDPDLGWHLKYGEYFWQHGTLLRNNTFSTMLPGYHWSNTSWLTDIISYTTYHFGGLFGLSLLGALVVTLTFYFLAKAAKMTLWEQTIVFPLILYLEGPINAVSFRGQQIVLLFIGILFYLISRFEEKPTLLWCAVPLFWIWVNIDGEFLLGYVLFVAWVVLYITKNLVEKSLSHENKKGKTQKWFGFTFEKLKRAFYEEEKEAKLLSKVLIVSFLVTFINPFGYGLHMDALSHIGSPLLKDIGEYLPFAMYSQDWWNEVIVGIILIFGLFILGFRGLFSEKIPVLGGGLLLFLLSLEVRRYAWPAYYLLFPLLAMTATFLKPDGKKLTKNISIVFLLIFLAMAVHSRYPFTKFTQYGWSEYCELQVLPCTPQSAEFLITHHLNHNIFTLYGWGGWLIWNYPQIKPAIDGRMDMWVQNGYSAFTDYYSIEQNMKDIDGTNYDVVYMSTGKPVYNRLLQLTKQKKWKLVYQDKYAGIFVRVDK